MVNTGLNLNSKRKSKKFPAHYGINDQYKYFRRELGKSIPKKYSVNRFTYSAIIKRCNTLISEMVINEAYEFRLPYRLGYLSIKRNKPKLVLNPDGTLNAAKSKLQIDFQATMKLWEKSENALKLKKKVYFTNVHSEGYICGWSWDKRTSNIKNITIYSFKTVRDNARAVAKAVKENKVDYFIKK
jgi:hypothetical protein